MNSDTKVVRRVKTATEALRIPIDTRPGRNGWAPGNYTIHCHDCGTYVIGDKRAWQCADCAYEETTGADKPEKPTIVKYDHHGTEVSVMLPLRGRHQEHCLCFNACKLFKPGTEDNCEIAQATYENCVKFGIVTPMWECPKYEQ